MPIASGTMLGPYEITGSLGAGGMGEVFRARDTRLGRDVAIKVLSATLAASPDARARFEREARAVSSLNHPNICTLHDVGRASVEGAGEVDFLVMELIEGEALSTRLARGPLPMRDVLSIGAHIADALDKAHRKSLVHRDLKPANVMLTKSGPKLLDFGLAKIAEASAGHTPERTVTNPLTQEGTIVGTFHYMAPEQVQGHEADTRSDIWALGVTLYEMATGRRAFDADNSASLMTAILRDEPKALGDLQPMTPPAFERLVRQCLAKDPDDRWQSAADVKRELEWIATSVIQTQRPVPAGAEHVWLPPSGGRRAAAFIAVATLVSGGVAAGWFLNRALTKAPPPARWDKFTQLTDSTGEEASPHVSADGTSFVFMSRARGSWDVFVQRVGGRNPTLIAGDPQRDESAPVFAPDTSSIAFHESDGDGGIFVVGATGESERRLTDFGFHPAWSADGQQIAFCTEEIGTPYSRTIRAEIWIVRVAGGSPTKVFAGDGVQPVWSPSGKRLAFWGSVQGQRDLWTIAVGGGEPVRVTNDAAVDWSPVWAGDGHLYFSSDRGGGMNVWRVRIDEDSGATTGEPDSVTTGVQSSLAAASLTKDGARLVFSAQQSSVNPMVASFDAATGQAGPATPLFQRTGILLPLSVSPDGKWLVLANTGDRQEDIFICRTDGSDLRRLTNDAARDRAPVWSPDGGRIMFYSNRAGEYNIWSIRRDGSALHPMTDRQDGGLYFPSFSPTGDRIVASDVRASPPRTFSIPVGPVWRGTGAEPLAGTEAGDVGLIAHAWSPDGRRIAGSLRTASGLSVAAGVYDIAEKRLRRIDTRVGWSLKWLADSRRFIAAKPNGGLVLIDADTGQWRDVTVRGPFSSIASVAISPDGRTLFVGGSQDEADIWMVERR
jgi:Tol biopolymer transport system component